MQVVLDNPYILMTDHKIQSPGELATVYELVAKSKLPLLIIADEVAPACIIDMLARREKDTLQIGRTHGIHAEPVTFGLKMALWADEMRRNIARQLAILTRQPADAVSA